MTEEEAIITEDVDNEDENEIDHFELRYYLNPALSDARESDNWTEEYPATKAQFAFAMDKKESESLSLRHSYGDAHADVYVIMKDRTELIVNKFEIEDNEITEKSVNDLLTDDGEVTHEEVFNLKERIFDGNNWVDFFPSRSFLFLNKSDSWEEYGHLSVQFDDEGLVIDTKPDEGWEILDLIDCSYGWTLGKDRLDNQSLDRVKDFENLLEEYDISYETHNVDGDTSFILCHTKDKEFATSVLNDTEDDRPILFKYWVEKSKTDDEFKNKIKELISDRWEIDEVIITGLKTEYDKVKLLNILIELYPNDFYDILNTFVQNEP